jgi:tRNA dimethylallyltransferase
MLTGDKKLILIVGPTASGKTDYSIDVALDYNSPIISCDSRQIYKELKIGTAPPDKDQLLKVRHYFIHSHSIFDYYTAGRYESEALALLEELYKRHDTLVMVGGSGLYADALCYGLDDFPSADKSLREKLTLRARDEGLESLTHELLKIDPESFYEIDTANPQRVIRALEVTISSGKKFSSFKKFSKKSRPFKIERVYIERDREELYERINRRVDKMMECGLLDEALSLFRYKDLPALKTVGYRELFEYIEGKVTLEEAVELIKRNTRRYAKRQITWFKR